MTLFIALTALMLLVALSFLLLPIMRQQRKRGTSEADRRLRVLNEALAAGVIDQQEFDSKLSLPALANSSTADSTATPAWESRLLIVAIAVLVPIGAFLIYRSIGKPDALSQVPVSPVAGTVSPANPDTNAKPGMDMSMAIDSLKTKLEAKPDNVDGWLLLGRAYKSVDRNSDATEALRKAYALAPDRPEVEIAYAESLALMSPDRRIDGEPLKMIRHSLAADPANQDGLWLLGMSEYQNGRYANAIVSWEKIRAQLAPDSDVLESVTSMIADANGHLGITAPAAGTSSADPPSPVDSTAAGSISGPQIKVHVTLAKSLAVQVGASDTLFVYAKASSGPPMPIAIQKLQASALPATVTLTDGMGMMPTMKLSQFPQVIIAARISKSGNATPQSGDLQAVSAPVDVNRREILELTIDQAVP